MVRIATWPRKLLAAALLTAPLGAQSADPDALRRRFEAGQRAIVENRYADASRELEQAQSLAPEIAEIKATLGFAYFQQGRFSDAVPVLQRAIALKPSLPNLDILLAASLSELGRFREALPGLEKGFANAPDAQLKRLAGLQLQRAYTGLRRDREAVETTLELIKLYPDDPETLYHAGRVVGNFAFVTMQRLTETAPGSLWTHLAAGEADESAGQYEQAVTQYRKVLELDPGRPGVHFRLGRALLRSSGDPGVVEEAMAEFRAELEADPTNANAAYELAEIHRRRGELDRAEALFSQAVDHYPEFEQAQLGLAAVLNSLEKPAMAVAHLQTALALNDRNAVAYYRLAQAHRALGETEKMRSALEVYQRLRQEAQRPTAAGASSEPVTAQQVDSGGEP